MSELIIQYAGDPPFVDCKRCEGRGYVGLPPGDPEWCADCDGPGEIALDMTALATLAHNLAIGGALCRAFVMGLEWADAANVMFDVRNAWRPGCGRSAT